MRNQWNRIGAGAVLALVACVAGTAALAAPKGTIVLGSTNSTSSHYTVSAAMVKAIKAGIPAANVSQIETGASVDKVRRLTQQLFELATLQTTGPVPQRERFRLDELVADVVQKFELHLSPAARRSTTWSRCTRTTCRCSTSRSARSRRSRRSRSSLERNSTPASGAAVPSC